MTNVDVIITNVERSQRTNVEMTSAQATHLEMKKKTIKRPTVEQVRQTDEQSTLKIYVL